MSFALPSDSARVATTSKRVQRRILLRNNLLVKALRLVSIRRDAAAAWQVAQRAHWEESAVLESTCVHEQGIILNVELQRRGLDRQLVGRGTDTGFPLRPEPIVPLLRSRTVP